MISITQDKNTFFYINWIPSEQGPLILDYGQELVKKDLNDLYYNALDNIRLKIKTEDDIFSISVDSNSVMFSETDVDDQFDHFDILDWFNEKQIGNQTEKKYETLHYLFSKNQNKYLNIHFQSIIKDKLKLFAQDNNAEIRSIGLGIFSAEISARCIYNADVEDSYAIIKFTNICEALIIDKGELVSYIQFRIKNDKTSLKMNFGDLDYSKKFLKEIDILIGGKNKTKLIVEHLYFYKGKGKHKSVDNLLKLKNNKITPINIFSKINLNNDKKIKDNEGMQFAENGSSFWGIDV